MDLECAVCLELLSEEPTGQNVKVEGPPPAKKTRRSSNRLSQQRGEGSSQPVIEAGPSTSAASSTLCVTKCGHPFHRRCVHLWFETKKSCPHCDTKLAEKDLGPLYLPISAENKRCKMCVKSDQNVKSLTKEVGDLKERLQKEKATNSKKTLGEGPAAIRALKKEVLDLKMERGDFAAQLKAERSKSKERLNELAIQIEELQQNLKKEKERKDRSQRRLEEKRKEYCTLMRKNDELKKKYEQQKKEVDQGEKESAVRRRSLRSSLNSSSSSESTISTETVILSSDDEY